MTNIVRPSIDKVIPSSKDARDYIYSATGGNFPARLDLKPHVFEIEDQGSIGSCTANSTISACEQLRPGNYSRLFAYYNARRDSGNMGNGVELRRMINTLYVQGAPEEKDWPYIAANENVQPPASLYNGKTKIYAIKKYEKLFSCAHGDIMPQDRDYRITAALNAGLPVIIGAQIRNDLYRLSGPWQTHKLSLTEHVISNHAMLIIGYDDTVRKWLVQNSWGKYYADGGFFGYGYDNLAQDCYEAWVVTDFEHCTARPLVGKTRATVFLTAGDAFTVADSGVTVVASSGKDLIRVLPGVTDILADANLNALELSENRSQYQIVVTQGVGLQIKAIGAVVATFTSLNQPLMVVFKDATRIIEQTGRYDYTVDGVKLNG